jgi:hypothetical protein
MIMSVMRFFLAQIYKHGLVLPTDIGYSETCICHYINCQNVIVTKLVLLVMTDTNKIKSSFFFVTKCVVIFCSLKIIFDIYKLYKGHSLKTFKQSINYG